MGPCLKYKFPDANQGPALSAGLSQGSSLRPAVLSVFSVQFSCSVMSDSLQLHRRQASLSISFSTQLQRTVFALPLHEVLLEVLSVLRISLLSRPAIGLLGMG